MTQHLDVACHETVCVLESRSRFVLKWKRRSLLLRRPPSYFFSYAAAFSTHICSVKVSIEAVGVFFWWLSDGQDLDVHRIRVWDMWVGVGFRSGKFDAGYRPMFSLPAIDKFVPWSASIFIDLWNAVYFASVNYNSSQWWNCANADWIELQTDAYHYRVHCSIDQTVFVSTIV